ncbi:NAD(+) kinase [Prochlorococcus sp. MIT 1223]|uniref:NAD(+) kinase n=1 Tax=Prochlorococcus sp. MIT 1223 TaxID=3096217 RepID=UPI002A753634|nr:NAD(+) kinase [Prochlorococcus sp. MIT 1223]
MLLKNVWIIYRSNSEVAEKEALRCFKKLDSLGVNVLHRILGNQTSSIKDLLNSTKVLPNLVIILGGDGTVLRAARQLAIKNIPIISFNVGGNLGFLTHEKSLLNHKETWQKILDGRFKLQKRMMLHANLELNYKSVNNLQKCSYWALNDFYLRSYKDEFSPTCRIGLEIDGEIVDEYKGDGLIISTPTGSTAYTLATGGPIVNPEIDAIVVSAICPMSLSSRPIVIPASSKIIIKTLGDANEKVKMWKDGETGAITRPGDKCTIEKSKHNVSMIVLEGSPTYYRTLSQKLHWAGSLVNNLKNN